MADINDFFSSRNSVDQIHDNDITSQHNYLDVVKAFERLSYQSIYLIDYQKKNFEYVSDNPLFLCGHTAKEVEQMGYAFYFKYVLESDLQMLLKINSKGFEYYDQLSMEERTHYTISYDFHLKNNEGKVFLINHKLTPLFLNQEGKIWKALCMVSLSSEQNAGNIIIYKHGGNEIAEYDLEGNYWIKKEKIVLTDREKDILKLSTSGFTVSNIAEKLFVSPDTIKFHRKKLFEKLNVSNIAEAVSYSTTNKLI